VSARDPELTSLLHEHAARHGVPGAALCISRAGNTTTAVYGVVDTRTGARVTDDTRFAIGSLGKSMVATAFALLAADGRLRLDDMAVMHVPELRGASWAERATIRDLLANRSRLPLLDRHEFEPSADEDDGVLSRFAAGVSSGERTGSFWSYSNAGWCLLGRALEIVTGVIWEEAMRSEVIGPLGLEQTTFANSPVTEPRATGHRRSTPVRRWSPRSLGPAGSTLLSTATDLARFAEAHLTEPALAELRESHAEVAIHSWLDAWCLGWARFDWKDGPVWGWDGLVPGQRAILRLVPDTGTAVALLTNGDNGRAVYRSLFAELMTLPPSHLRQSPGSAGDLARFVGEYAWPDRHWTASIDGDGLLLEGDGRRIEAQPLDDRTFLVDASDPDNPTVTIDEDVLYVMLWGLPRVVRG
jgi:CubicO group peptidase (beta-lactamase class C family)